MNHKIANVLLLVCIIIVSVGIGGSATYLYLARAQKQQVEEKDQKANEVKQDFDKKREKISLQEPKAGTVLNFGDTYTISWTVENFDGNVNLAIYNEAYGSGGLAYLVKNIPVSTGKYEWKTSSPLIPEPYSVGVLHTGEYTFMLQSTTDKSIYDNTETKLKIVVPE